MATLIKERRIVADSWHLLERGPKGELPEVPARGDVVVPLALWLERRDGLLSRAEKGTLGVWLAANDGPEALAADVRSFPLIAVHFPKFADGRGCSSTRLPPSPPACPPRTWWSPMSSCGTSSKSKSSHSTPKGCTPIRST